MPFAPRPLSAASISTAKSRAPHHCRCRCVLTSRPKGCFGCHSLPALVPGLGELSTPPSKVQCGGIRNAMARGIFWLATSLPSTEKHARARLAFLRSYVVLLFSYLSGEVAGQFHEEPARAFHDRSNSSPLFVGLAVVRRLFELFDVRR
jgi:hypothetical protein